MRVEEIYIWISSLLGGLALCGARLGWLLFRVAPDPPEDPEALALWKRKRRWLIYSEFSALPAFATFSVLLGKIGKWDVETIVLVSMVLGALGFAFFLDALETLIRKRLGIGKD